MKNEKRIGHRELVDELYEQLNFIFDKSEQAIYLYLDDTHKVCNKKFAVLLGYKSADEWRNVQEPFTQAFVANRSQRTLVSAYQNAMNRMIGSTIDVVWKRKDGSEVETNVMLVPMAYNGHGFALHFISKM